MSKGKNLASGFQLPKAPKHTPVKETTARLFVGAKKKAGKSDKSLRRDGVDTVRLALYFPPDVAKALRVRCIEESRSVSDAVTAAVSAWLGHQK
jgi:hypothetical protein